ncbi:unnamed protein product [Ilex paraguariensis]|uniref:rRNA methyltransferase 1, mitochondrial n=1 Tax=Ilex paraguariensis TaxID=185542 RepID=A0ABC8TXC9_9AQUA
MLTMYCNFTKGQTLAFMVCTQPPRIFNQVYTSKPHALLVGFHPKLTKHSLTVNSRSLGAGLGHKSLENSNSVRPRNVSIDFFHEILGEEGSLGKPRNFSTRFRLKNSLENYPFMRSFSSSHSQKFLEGCDSVVNAGKPLPWLATPKAKEAKRSGEMVTTKTSRSSWEQSAEKFLNGGGSGLESREMNKFEYRENEYKNRNDRLEEENEEGKFEVVDDPRWDKIKNRFNKIVDVKPGSGRPEFQKWNKQENWGRKTWKEGTESTVPKMVGEGIYGVGPVLAALSAGRREFFALYVQEGLDLSGNNRKKKDKKGFEKVLKIAEKIGLSEKVVSKHDLNMVVDNRPHQGLVLDASPLEMVGIKELDPVSVEAEKAPLWVALDEVTDPQNLGAIIRSAYFFGVSGVVLCAKNSAPLSGVVSKASAGSLELMELRSCKNMMQFLTSSAENGWRVLGGSVSTRAVPLNEVLPGEPTILVLGSEGTGLRPLVERSCTQLIRIPGNIPMDVTGGQDEKVKTAEMDYSCSLQEFQSFMAVESLNVSVAAGVLLHHLIGSTYDNDGHSQEKQNDVVAFASKS